MTTPTIFEELRRVRHQISGKLGHDPRNIVAYYAKLQSMVANRTIDLSGDAKMKKPDNTNKFQSNED
jgi:lipopolysaccharide export system protein LptA